MTNEELELRIIQLEALLNAQPKVVVPAPPITHMTINAVEGYIFKRSHDGFLMGDKLILGYDYSLGFRRIDKEIFYTQVLKPVEDEGAITDPPN